MLGGQSSVAFQFRMLGFPVIIEWGHIFIVGLIGLLSGMNYNNATAGVMVAMVLFISIFVHELGHALMCKRVGSHVHEMRLVTMGGFVRHSTGLSHPAAFLITAGGPLANLLIIIIAKLLIGAGFLQNPYALFMLKLFVQWNILLIVFNMLPVIPLDGGHLLHRLLYMFYSNSSDGKVVAIKRWKHTPDQIVGKIGVVFCYLWIPLIFLLYFTMGILVFFGLPLQANKDLASGRARLPL